MFFGQHALVGVEIDFPLFREKMSVITVFFVNGLRNPLLKYETFLTSSGASVWECVISLHATSSWCYGPFNEDVGKYFTCHSMHSCISLCGKFNGLDLFSFMRGRREWEFFLVPSFNCRNVQAALKRKEGTPWEYVTRTSVASISISF